MRGMGGPDVPDSPAGGDLVLAQAEGGELWGCWESEAGGLFQGCLQVPRPLRTALLHARPLTAFSFRAASRYLVRPLSHSALRSVTARGLTVIAGTVTERDYGCRLMV